MLLPPLNQSPTEFKQTSKMSHKQSTRMWQSRRQRSLVERVKVRWERTLLAGSDTLCWGSTVLWTLRTRKSKVKLKRWARSNSERLSKSLDCTCRKGRSVRSSKLWAPRQSRSIAFECMWTRGALRCHTRRQLLTRPQDLPICRQRSPSFRLRLSNGSTLKSS